MNIKKIKARLETEFLLRNSPLEISIQKPDPLLVAREQTNEYAILTCALFSYGSAKQIVNFLQTLPFELLEKAVSEQQLRTQLHGMKYRFQTTEDIVQWFLLLQRIQADNKGCEQASRLKQTFFETYQQDADTIQGLRAIIDLLWRYAEGYDSKGFAFLIGKSHSKSPLKRLNMFLKWMAREDNVSIGLWNTIRTKDLIIPLDTHLLNFGKKNGLIKSKSYDIKAAIEMTESLKKIDAEDPTKYDFAIYRIGQEKIR
jgi:uncharacterized protein (TIGR02757 family)